MASLEQFRKIAIYCERYNKKTDDNSSLKNNSSVEYESCTNCTHFTTGKYCELDLIDKVLSSLSMEQDLKS
ncbi:hypothetical protein [Tissierella creatinophila]|uniref:Uncharacterized protein n=1 Tax=Tissierella creatinophila DSM 6911 TaxID=1123403 RepID=A0A1U7M8D8_TISCR|nr:hypothetical protein [Tissierella creatinophila]OLS03479.1 hypothetical protein TICRE_04730 [Tissierella creatinophila DSM 6911]